MAGHPSPARAPVRHSALAALLVTASTLPALAQTPIPMPAAAPVPTHGNHHRHAESASTASNGIVVEAGTGKMVTLSGAAANLFVADPKVAEARPASPTSVFVFGIGAGRTTIAAMDAGGKPVGLYEVTVVPNTYAANGAAAAITSALPGQHVGLQATPQGLQMTGQVRTPADADRAATAARTFLTDKQTLDNRLNTTQQVQVMLRVRIVEMDRTLTRDLGVNWQNLGGDLGNAAQIGLATAFPLANLATGASAPAILTTMFKKTSVEAIIDALAQDQLVHLLAEPNLTALSGEPASFLVGGEFPIPVAQQEGNVTVEFKQYGISLAFVPTVMSDGHINMRVRPEVSSLTTQGSVQLTAGNSSITIPALQVRRADTTVELGSGQSFAIAGLLSDQVSHGGNGVPFLGDTPILGALFRSDSFLRQQTELVILVTPFIVRPVSNPAVLRTPDQTYHPPNDLERILLLRQNGVHPAPGEAPAPLQVQAHVPGDAGFLVQ